MVQAIHDTKGSIGVNLYKGFLSTNPDDATPNDAVRLFGEIIKIADVNTLHMGADLDGAELPEGIADITSIPGLFDRVQDEYSLTLEEMKKIKSGNVIRIMNKIWK
jgi:microsomal dipeptidase-like Zn-dependent dipeptidase